MRERSFLLGTRWRWILLSVVAVLALGAASLYAVQAYGRYQDRSTGHSAAEVTGVIPLGDRMVFRNTARGEGYGMAAAVSLDDPAGRRTLTNLPCDRVDATVEMLSCMRIVRGIPTTFETEVMDSVQQRVARWDLPGIPSRTRVSDGGLVATTSFVTGHSYAADGFSTETVVHGVNGADYGNLQEFTILIDGKELSAVDRNVWGVSFLSENEFFATVASGGKTWLVAGNLHERTLISVTTNSECPSVSPDKTRVAYKKLRPGPGPVHWDIAVLDLDSKEEQQITLDQGFDDQLEWLDDQTLLFGQPRKGAIGDSDVYSIRAEAAAQPQLLVEHAWSPSVVRQTK